MHSCGRGPVPYHSRSEGERADATHLLAAICILSIKPCIASYLGRPIRGEHSPGEWDETFRLLNDLRNPLLRHREE